jgi:hypothetical protein
MRETVPGKQGIRPLSHWNAREHGQLKLFDRRFRLGHEMTIKYYVLRHEDEGGVFIDGDVVFLPALAGHYQIGKDMVPPGTRLELVLDRRTGPLRSDFFLTTSGAFFVSAAMKDVLSRHATSLDFFPVDVRHANGSPADKTCFLIHAKDKLACFDYVNAEYAGKPMVLGRIAGNTLSADYKIRGIKQLRINEEKAAGRDFFFIDGVIWIDPVISETVLDAAQAAGLALNVEAV